MIDLVGAFIAMQLVGLFLTSGSPRSRLGKFEFRGVMLLLWSVHVSLLFPVFILNCPDLRVMYDHLGTL
jgi:hypothetical protein